MNDLRVLWDDLRGMLRTFRELSSGRHQVLDLVHPGALIVSLIRGSWTLLAVLAHLLHVGLSKAVSSPAAPAAPARTAPPPKVSISKEDGPPTEGQEEGEEAGEEPPPKPPKPKTGKPAQVAQAAGGWLQNAALIAIVIVVAAGTLGSVWAALVYLLRPYATIVMTALTVLWIAAALTADAVTHPADDHERNAGEETLDEDLEQAPEEAAQEPQETQQEDPWPATRELLRTFVEHRVTAGASGLKEGVKGRGASVDHLLAEQQEKGGLIGYDRKAMIKLLEKAGITVRTQMKFHVCEQADEGEKWRERNLPGVHIEDLAKDLGRTPNMPAHLVPDHSLGAPPVLAEKTPRNVAPIPLARTAGE